MLEIPEVPVEASFTPRELVSELDRYIVGQHDAKKAVAIALRNRWRRRQVPPPLRDEIMPKNIIMIGDTGVGKTEIARRLARLARAPFVKVEASKFTEVGYVGRDVDSMVRDLVESAIAMVKQEERENVAVRARANAVERVVDLIAPEPKRQRGFEVPSPSSDGDGDKKRDRIRQQVESGELDAKKVKIEVAQAAMPPALQVLGGQGMEDMGQLQEMFQNLFPKKQKSREVTVKEALDLFTDEEADKLVDQERVHRIARARAEETGIIFIDEIDKVAGRERANGPDVSREGVQRDLLPIVEGSTVSTKYGPVKTDHVLFIAAGAFHVSKVSDLIPELQGRFPIRVELKPLTRDDLLRILTEPENSLPRQYQALMQTEGLTMSFAPDSLEAIAEIAADLNRRAENIGARRLHTVMEKLLEEISFRAPELPKTPIVIDAAAVQQKLGGVLADQNLERYIL
jgi:ATP-dependent HslUV protease ATP-binding subunit HslU